MDSPPSPSHLACVLGLILLGSLACAVIYFHQRQAIGAQFATFKARRWAQTTRRAALLGFSLCATAILCLVLAAANTVMTSAHQHKMFALMEAIQTCFVSYEIDNGTASPDCDLAGFTRCLSGSNPEDRIYIKLADDQKNERGEVIDLWGTPLAMKVLDAQDLQILSAGPDKIWKTPDDLHLH